MKILPSILLIGMLFGVTKFGFSTTILVTNTNDSGPGSFRQATLDAMSGDTVSIDGSISTGTVTLTTGEIAFSRDIVILGNGLTVDGNFSSRVFNQTGAGTSLYVENLTITGGYITSGYGAGILGASNGTIILRGCTIDDNTVYSTSGWPMGGGIAAQNMTLLDINNCVISNNNAINNGSSGRARGAGILLNNTDATIVNSQFLLNEATVNNSFAEGGGIYIETTKQVLIENNVFDGNLASTYGGGGGCRGGALYTRTFSTGQITVRKNEIKNNQGNTGAGIEGYNSQGLIDIQENHFLTNTALFHGGGIMMQLYSTSSVVTCNVEKNTFESNVSGYTGAGAYLYVNNSQTCTNCNYSIENNTFYGNLATGAATPNTRGGGLYVQLVGGTNHTIKNNTIYNNQSAGTSGQGGGLYFIANAGSPFTLSGNIIAWNTCNSGADVFNGNNLASHGFNLIRNNDAVTTEFPAGVPNGNNDYVGTSGTPLNPMMGTLGDYGGATKTIPPLAGSPSIDPVGRVETVADQRGYSIVNTKDIGSHEFNGTCPDSDGDGVCNDIDNCPSTMNGSQADSDGDGIGDVCDIEECDGLDNDGDGDVDEGFDVDGDGYTTCQGDCDDNDPTVHPGATELCDGIDNNCDGTTDIEFPLLGTPCSAGVGACEQYGVYVCDGTGTTVTCSATPGNPTAEVCDGIDNNCNGQVDEGFDSDSDGIADCFDTEECDGIDNDGDGQIDEGFDIDGDGYTTCQGDCDDNDPNINPGEADDECDGIDNNCDGMVDENWLPSQPCEICTGGSVQSTDATPPAEPTLADVTGECTATATVPTTTDDCDGTVTGTTSDPLTYSTQGTHTITWTFTDSQGNATITAQNVVIDDVTDPVTPTLADVTGECTATATAPTTTDNCSGTITGTTTDPLTYSTQGTHVITWTFDDGNGNVINVNQNVVIDDITDPVTPTLADVTGECTATATAPTTTDNCAGTITGTTTDPLTYTTQGTHVITWTFDDGNGNVINVNQNVVIDDITDPVTPTLADVTGECTATATAPTTTDNCSGTITGTTTDPLTYSTQGTHVITWTFDDGNGNVINVNQNVVIDDITDPVTPTLADVTGECTATATAPTTTDNCAGTITGTTTDPLTYSTQGTHVIAWTFDDGNGNVINVNQNVVIDDVTDPTASNPDTMYYECVGDAVIDISVVDDEVDNCGAPIVTFVSDVVTGNGCQDTIVRTFNVSDAAGNNIDVTQIILIEDVTAPTASNPATINVQCAADVPAPSIGWVTDEADNCTAAPVVAWVSDVSDGLSCPETITRTFSVTDDCGNQITVDQLIIVMDTDAPVADVTNLPTETAFCDVTLTAPTATDNCSGAITATTATIFPINTPGTTTVTWTYTDACGNTSTQTQDIVIEDIDVTTWIANDNITIVASNVDAGVTYQWIDCNTGQEVVGETNHNYTPTYGSDFAVIVTQDGCSDTSDCVNSTVGIDELMAAQVVLYPNPTDGVFNVKYDGQIISIEVVDMLGREVSLPINLVERLVDASHLTPGKYFVQITTIDEQLITKEILISQK